jgi:hypothetical protein
VAQLLAYEINIHKIIVVMQKIGVLAVVFFIGVALNSCSKRYHPSKTPVVTISNEPAPVATKSAVVKRKPKPVFPKEIYVNDSVAQKSIDGRLYYDRKITKLNWKIPVIQLR